jgi:hypothetical protein
MLHRRPRLARLTHAVLALTWRVIGARLQAKYTPTDLNDKGSDFCDPFGFCQDWLHQFELTGGVVVRF